MLGPNRRGDSYNSPINDRKTARKPQRAPISIKERLDAWIKMFEWVYVESRESDEKAGGGKEERGVN